MNKRVYILHLSGSVSRAYAWKYFDLPSAHRAAQKLCEEEGVTVTVAEVIGTWTKKAVYEDDEPRGA